ncbi:MAG: hypothetical protein N2560_08220 [Ignavibacteria bacterium]|nr:hypothetical protein [Ignavibacteria bacterium]
MLRYIALILIILIVFLFISNFIYKKIVSKAYKINPKSPNDINKYNSEVIYKDDEITILKGESSTKSKEKGTDNYE